MIKPETFLIIVAAIVCFTFAIQADVAQKRKEAKERKERTAQFEQRWGDRNGDGIVSEKERKAIQQDTEFFRDLIRDEGKKQRWDDEGFCFIGASL
jgi:hypothetical protein